RPAHRVRPTQGGSRHHDTPRVLLQGSPRRDRPVLHGSVPDAHRLCRTPHEQRAPREERCRDTEETATGTVTPRRWPILTDNDRAAVARVLDRGVLSGAGAPEMRALEAEFAATVGRRFVLVPNSGTSP